MLGIASSTTPYQPVAPTIIPAGGRFEKPTNVRLSSLTTDATIYYTTDGSTPSVVAGVPQGTTLQYTLPFVVSSAGTTTVQSIAVLGGTNISDVSEPSNFFIDTSFRPGSDWFDTEGHLIESHMGEVKYFNGKYYWYGVDWNRNSPEATTTSNVNNEIGIVTAYSSPDLINWKNEGAVLYLNGLRAQRPHVLYNSTTSQYVLWANNVINGSNSKAIIATASSPVGPFTAATTTFAPDVASGIGDMNLFQDSDGSGYLIYVDKNNRTSINRLTSDYLSIVAGATTTPFASAARLSPVMFKRGSTYFLMATNVNQFSTTTPMYATSSSVMGSWSSTLNPFQVSGQEDYTIGYRTQPTYVFQVPGMTDAFVYMGDRWNVMSPMTDNGLYAQRHVWLPVTFPTSNTMSISYSPSWTLNGTFFSTALPSAVSGFAVVKVGSTSSASWTNVESNSYSLFLDRATDSGFTQNVVSESLVATTTSFIDSSVVGGTTYYYRVRTVNASGTNYSQSIFFSLIADIEPPSVTLTEPVNGSTIIGTTTLSATSTDDIGVASIQFYIDSTSTGAVGATSTYSIVWDSNTVANGSYSISAVAKDAAGNLATSTISVTVNNSQVVATTTPTVTVQSATSVGATEAILNGTITATGGDTSTIVGFNYGLTASYGTTATTSGSYGVGAFNKTVSGLVCATTYHYQAFATNSAGTGSSTDQTFTTSACPTYSIAVSPNSIVQNSTGNSITITGTNTSWTAGTPGTPTFSISGGTGANITSQVVNSTTSATIVLDAGSATGTLVVLDPSTSATTSITVNVSASVPTLTTQDPTSVTQYSATLNGTITATGSASPAIRGFQYGPTTSYGATTTESGTFSSGIFSASLTGLGCNYTYHYRSYASSTAGTGYGNDKTITTSACSVSGATGEIQFASNPYGYGITGDRGYLNQGRIYTNAYDGDFNTYWDSNQTNPWFGLDLTTPARATKILISPALGSTARMQGSILQGATSSAQSGPWTNIYTIPSTGYYPQRQFTEIPVDTGGVSYRYYRLLTPAGLGGNVAEFRVIGLPGSATLPEPLKPNTYF